MALGTLETEAQLRAFIEREFGRYADTRIRQLQSGVGGGGGPPTGLAGGVLAGNYPNPTFAVDMATQAELNAAIIGAGAGPESFWSRQKWALDA